MPQRILFLNRWPQFRDGGRWDNRLARPEDLIDHDRYQVTYLCDAAGRSGVPAGAARVYQVADFTDRAAVLGLVHRLVAEQGGFDHVIAFSEYLLDLAAEIRARHAVPGAGPEQTSRFRDKTTMKTLLADAGVAVPRWIRCATAAQTLAAAEDLGYPLILKPVRGASSQGVYKAECAGDLRAHLSVLALADTGSGLGEYEIEQYVPGDILHADGVVDTRGRLLFLAVSRYVSTCLDFEHGEPFGSIVQTDPDVRAAAEDFTRRCLAALDLRAGAFHLEYFDTADGPVFLEVGARVPGADVPTVIHDVTGVNLFRLWVDVLLGRPAEPVARDFEHGGGWLMIPRPKPLPQRVLHATPLLGRIPYLHRELVPAPGDLLEHAGGYATVQAGRFLYRGGTQDQIADAVRRTLAAYRLRTEPVATAATEEIMAPLKHADLATRTFVLFAEDCFGLFTSKIAASLLRYRGPSCVAVIDSTKAGKTVQDVLGYGGDIPILATVEEALPYKPEVLIVGKGLHSADLPDGWKQPLLAAMRNKLHIINCIHYRLETDPDLARAARENGITVWETKDAPTVPLNKARVLGLDTWILHTCGSDSNIGKKTTALQLYTEANRQGIKTGFAATGQSAMMITGHGVAVDGVPGDFMGGAVEQVVLEAAEGNDWVVVEGQGSLNHIAASGVALAILHGALPHALVFCHRMGLERTKVWDIPVRPIPELIRMNEELTVFIRPAKVAAVSLNSAGFAEEEYRREAAKLEDLTGLPVVDPCRDGGAERLVGILREHQRGMGLGTGSGTDLGLGLGPDAAG